MPRARRSAVMGLDLSTRASAAQILPLNWGGDWTMMRTVVTGAALTKAASEDDRSARIELIALELVELAEAYGVRDVWIESYAFSAPGAHTAGELGGVVRLELRRAGCTLHVAHMSTARKLLMGYLPKGAKGSQAAKKEALRVLVAAGMPFKSTKKAEHFDEADAFVAANLGLAEAGGYCFAQAPRIR